ncbi:uncharacterized protein LOC106673818 isoform X2 [Cimex lectularius]|uniref:F-box domain-containing protein n=1 Tax=Cimex lectularius TaxID=79782 RepID=A0A8I6SAY0_CIMLE|nr:uncharacterized protein LOC106673818 isoform X2 [Cimex lectularius]
MSFRFGDLPTELIYKIFSYLNSTDLARSCMVSKRWRSIGNSDTLWKHLCELDDIHEEYIDSKNIPSAPANGQTLEAMNKWALLYGAFAGELVRNWKNDDYKEVKLDSSVEHITIRKGWMFHSFYNHSSVDVYRLKEKVFRKVQRLRTLIPNDGSLFLSYDCETLIITSNNIVVIYLNMNGEFIFERVIALDSHGVKTTVVDKEAFMSKIFSHTLLIFCIAIFKEYIWLFNEFSREVLIINRKTGNIEKIINGENHVDFCVNENQLVVVAKNGIFSFCPNGREKIITKNQIVSHKKNITFNTQYVCFKDDTSNDSLVFINLTYWAVKRYNFANPLCITLHSELPLAYILSFVNNQFFLQAMSILTGEIIWSELLTLPKCQSQQQLTLVVILQRYLLLCSNDRANQYFAVYSIKTGKFLYSSRFTGSIQMFSHRFLVSRAMSNTSRRLELILRSYL